VHVSRQFFDERRRLGNFRRLVTRWEYHSDNYLGFIELGCIMIMLRHL